MLHQKEKETPDYKNAREKWTDTQIKMDCHKAERNWRYTKLTNHYEALRNSINIYNNALRTELYTDQP